EAAFMAARGVVRHRQAGLSLHHPQAAEVGRQRRAGTKAMTSLAGKTLLITGASRGIGLAIALRAARDGANIAILAKTDTPHPRLKGTIHEAAAAIESAGGRALALKTDIRDEAQVSAAVKGTAKTFGGIDFCINNAS